MVFTFSCFDLVYLHLKKKNKKKQKKQTNAAGAAGKKKFMLFFSFGQKIVQQNFRKFGYFCFFVILLFLLKKCFCSAKCIFARLGAILFFKKKNGFRIPKFPIFYTKKQLFFDFWTPPDVRAEGPKKNLAYFFPFL